MSEDNKKMPWQTVLNKETLVPIGAIAFVIGVVWNYASLTSNVTTLQAEVTRLNDIQTVMQANFTAYTVENTAFKQQLIEQLTSLEVKLDLIYEGR
jgi:prefoldin subunit 5